MANSTTDTSNSAKLEADLRRLDVNIRQLKVQYDMFFAGGLTREPFELRRQVERTIKRYANASIRKYAHQFQLNSLISRFNSLSELWGKTIRTREERGAAAAVARESAPGQARLVARCRVRNPAGQDAELRDLYERFQQARRVFGDKKRQISYEKFVRGITAQTRALRKQSGCAEIELRVVVSDGSVELKARADK